MSLLPPILNKLASYGGNTSKSKTKELWEEYYEINLFFSLYSSRYSYVSSILLFSRAASQQQWLIYVDFTSLFYQKNCFQKPKSTYISHIASMFENMSPYTRSFAWMFRVLCHALFIMSLGDVMSHRYAKYAQNFSMSRNYTFHYC